MRNFLLGLAAAACVMAALMAQQRNDNPQPTCKMCPGTYIPVAELQATLDERTITVRCILQHWSKLSVAFVFKCHHRAPRPRLNASVT